MRVLAWPDAFPASDIGVLNALGTRDVALAAQQATAWQPWRSYAVMRLWQALEENMTPTLTSFAAPRGGAGLLEAAPRRPV
jgi:3-methyladenine DNA glycosylase/8-oxoguanine DNA glycosylase